MLFSIFYLSTCSHSKSMSKSGSENKYIPKIGDDVRILTIEGSEYKMFITEITPDSIKSEKYKFSFKEIQSIERLKNNPIIFLGIFVGAVIIFEAILLMTGMNEIDPM